MGLTLNGQLGIETDMVQKQPIEIPFKCNIKAVSCGDKQVMALDQDRSHLFVWGDSSLSQLPAEPASPTVPTDVSK